MAGVGFRNKSSRWVNVPFSPARLPFFYGWVILAGTTLGVLASVPGQTIGVGVFIDNLIGVLGLSRTQLSLAYMFGTIASSFILPFAGTVTDWVGCRIMITLSALCMGLSLFVMAQVGTIAGWFESTTMVVAATAVLFLLIRFFGQGCLTIVSRVCVSKWFNHRRGTATGISSVFVGFFFSASPAFLNYLVERAGWQQSYIILGLIVGVGMTTIGWLLYRDNPEQCGLVMDGCDDEQWLAKMVKRVPETVKEFTQWEAMRTLAFWSFSLMLGWQALFMTAVTFHITSLGAESGLSREQAYAVFPMIGFVSLFVSLGAGWISDRIKLKLLLVVQILGLMVATAGLLIYAKMIGRVLFVGGYSVSVGLFGLLLTIVWPRYFGRKHLGAINGLTSSILVFASAIGPILYSALKDLTGDFHTAVALSLIVPAVMLIPALLVRNPQSLLREKGVTAEPEPTK